MSYCMILTKAGRLLIELHHLLLHRGEKVQSMPLIWMLNKVLNLK